MAGQMKSIAVVFIVCAGIVLSCNAALRGDVMYLNNSRDGVPVDTIEVKDDSIVVAIEKNDLYSMTLTFEGGAGFPDAVTLLHHAEVPCKIVRLMENKLIADFSKRVISSLQLDFPGGRVLPGQRRERNDRQERRTGAAYTHQKRRDDGYMNRYEGERYDRRYASRQESASIESVPVDARPYRERNYGQVAPTTDADDFLDLDMLGDETTDTTPGDVRQTRSRARRDVKDDLLAEIRGTARSKPDKTNDTGRRHDSGGLDLLDKTLPQNSSGAVSKRAYERRDTRRSDLPDNSAGRIKGRFISSGNPLASCKVRLVRLRKDGVKYSKDTNSGARPIEAVTDRRGEYTFNNVPPGMHKLYWKPPMESSWIRRVSMEPDVVVRAGDVAYLDDIETNQRILN